MPPTPDVVPKFAWLQHVTKGVAVVASTGAAIASIVSALHSNGVIGKGAFGAPAANTAAAWVRLTPAVDTATAIGDTVAFAATAADQHGSVLGGATPTWTTGDSSVATVRANGSVIARGPGTTTISVVVGRQVARAHLVVRQRVATLSIGGPTAMSPTADTLRLAEGQALALRARALDARGHLVTGRPARWSVDDSSVATVDAQGAVQARDAGHGTVSAVVDGAAASLPLAVLTTATTLHLVEGEGQRALAGQPLARAVVVRATTRRGAPAPGKHVTFQLSGTSGFADPLTATTDADGRARTRWTLGDIPGPQQLRASVEQVDSATVVLAEAEPVAANTRVVPVLGLLRARAGAVLDDSVAVRIADSTGRPLAGVPVRWSATHGAAQSIDSRTDSAGVARVRWTLGSKAGTQRIRALVGAPDSRIVPVEIGASALAGPAAGLAIVKGDRQQAAAGRALASVVLLRVTDATGNGAPAVAVSLAPSAGTVADSTPRTDSLGLVRVRWTLGRTAGTQTLAASAAGVPAGVTVAARGVAGTVANLSVDAVPPAKEAAPGRVRRLVVEVSDVHGNPVADVPVRLRVKSGSVTPSRALSDARGRVEVRWSMGTGADEHGVRASVPGTEVAGAFVDRGATLATPSRRGKT